MEAFSLLKYWRTTTGGGATANLRASNPTTTTTISTAISHSTAETDDDEEENGPFFDLEFAVPDEDPDGEDHDKQKTTDGLGEEIEDEEGDSDGTEGENDARGEEEDEGEFKFTLEPSDDLFFNGNLVPVEPSSIDDGSGQIAKPQFSLLKSASKFGVLMLKLKKSKQPNAGERTEPDAASVCLTKQSEKEAETQTQKQKPSEKEAEAQTQKQKPSQSKLFTVKLKVEEVPIVSLFTRDNSSRASSGTINNKSQKKETSDESGPDEKRVSKDGVQKYLKMVKPLYIRVSKRHGEKPSPGFSGQLSVQSPARSQAPKSEKTEAVAKSEPPAAAVAKSEPPAAVAAAASCEEKSGKQGKLLLPAGLRVVCKHLGKSRSASSAAVAAAPVSGATVKQGRRRDDSLLEQQDGIQSAIMHCKRSFNLSRDLEPTLFPRSVSDPSPKNPSN